MSDPNYPTELTRAEQPPADRNTAYAMFRALCTDDVYPSGHRSVMMQAFSSLSGIPYGVCEKAVEVEQFMELRRRMFNMVHYTNGVDDARRIYDTFSEKEMRNYWYWEQVRLWFIRSDIPSWNKYAADVQKQTGKHF